MTARLKGALLIVLPLILLIASSSYLKTDRQFIERKKLLMGSFVEIKVAAGSGADKKALGPAVERAFGEIARVEGVFSVFKPDSEISRINALKAGEKLRVTDEVFGLIQRSLEYNRTTKGAFDITVKPLVDLWAEADRTKQLPNAEAVARLRALVGPDMIILDDAARTISFATSGVKIDLGGIVQGYATDRAIRVLRENGVTDAIVNSSGDVYCLGRRSVKERWLVGIQHPRKRDELFLNLSVENKAAVTSGDYEKYFEIGGRRYSHVIDPRTGYPVGDATVSATVIADDATAADALATASLVLSRRDALESIRSTPGADAILIYTEDDTLKVHMSEGVAAKYEVTGEQKP